MKRFCLIALLALSAAACNLSDGTATGNSAGNSTTVNNASTNNNTAPNSSTPNGSTPNNSTSNNSTSNNTTPNNTTPDPEPLPSSAAVTGGSVKSESENYKVKMQLGFPSSDSKPSSDNYEAEVAPPAPKGQ